MTITLQLTMVRQPTVVETPVLASERAPFATLDEPGYCRQRAASEANQMLGADGQPQPARNLVLVCMSSGGFEARLPLTILHRSRRHEQYVWL